MAAAPTFEHAVHRVRTWTNEEYGQNLSAFMDEQPALFGFLLNLSEEFEDDEHEQLVRSALLLREGFRLAAIAVKPVDNLIIEDVTTGVVEAFEQLESIEALDPEAVVSVSRSPFVFTEVRNFLHQELRRGLPDEYLQQHNLMIVIDILIGCFEEALDIPEAPRAS
ncbi:MAG TPA: hypothetical protein DCE13_00325 [Cryomorphaceae bacterium]|jgi:hypothetical protein|nr:hypothetical protein [Cryomorphaceae bacterium]